MKTISLSLVIRLEQVETLRREGYRPFDYYQNEQLREVIDQIIRGDFSHRRTELSYPPLIQGLQYHDYYPSFY